MNVDLLPDYVHRPLQNERTEVRLLDILPAKTREEPLRGIIQRVQLGSQPYHALSYVWGNQKVDASYMEITEPDDKSTSARLHFRRRKSKASSRCRRKIGSNLANALKHLRAEYGSITIWVDALCIDQYNNEEKSHQVRRMTDIYSKATVVHAWLGPQRGPDDGNQSSVYDAFNFVDTLFNIVQSCHYSAGIHNEVSWLDACRLLAMPANSAVESRANEVATFCHEFREKTYRYLSAQGSWQRYLLAFQALSRVEYFSRIWILQECIRAKAQTFHYGDRKAPRNLLFLLLSFASEASGRTALTSVSASAARFDMRFFDCITVRNANNLKDILEMTYFSGATVREASKSQDLIFGLVGLSKGNEILVDYDLSTETVYTQTTEKALDEGFTDLLVAFKPYNAVARMPSWVYDWRTRGLRYFADFGACGNTTKRIAFLYDEVSRVPTTMRIRGSTVGHVTATGFHFSAVAEKVGFTKNAIATGLWRDHFRSPTAYEQAELERMISGFHKHHQTSIDESDLIALFTDTAFPAASFWFWWIQWTTRLWQFVSQHLGEKRQPNVHGVVSELLTRGQSKSVAVAKDCASLLDISRWTRPSLTGLRQLELFYYYAWGMRPVALDLGLVGYATESTEVGDEVVIFDGVKAPLVIRKSGKGASRLIGPAYICGTMQGQLMGLERVTSIYTLL